MSTVFTPNKLRQRELARPIALLGGPKSAEASALVDYLLNDHVLPARIANLCADKRQKLGPVGLARRRKVVGALMADLLDLHASVKPGADPAAGMHGVSPKDFCVSDLGFARSIFLEVTSHVASVGLLQVTKGAPRWHPAFDTFVVRGGDLTTYRLTAKALDLAEARGITVDGWSAHWISRTLAGARRRSTSCRSFCVPREVASAVRRATPGISPSTIEASRSGGSLGAFRN